MTSKYLNTLEFYQKEQIRMLNEFVSNLQKVTKEFQDIVQLIKEKDIKFTSKN